MSDSLSPTPPAANADRLDVMFTTIGPFLLAVEARHVRAIGDEGDPRSPAFPAPTDLAASLGEAVPSAMRPRRVLDLARAGGDVAVLVGNEVWPGRLAERSLQAVPLLVAGDLGRVGIGRVFLEEDGRFGYLLDPEALR